jgi:hypothetical protein
MQSTNTKTYLQFVGRNGFLLSLALTDGKINTAILL